jgi:hypothetical protein
VRVRVFALAVSLALAAPAPALALEAVTLPGGPLSVAVGSRGQCQSSYAGLGNNFYPPEGPLGDCGFFLGFPTSGNPAPLQKQVFGFTGTRGPSLSALYAPVGQRAPTGTGSAADPYREVTLFKVDDPTREAEGDYALVEETTTYVSGEAQFTSTYDVENITGESDVGVSGVSPAPATSLRFQAIYAGELSSGGEGLGSGLPLSGPPRLLGARDEPLGALGGFVEAPAPSPAWASYASGCWSVVPEPAGLCAGAGANDRGIWAAVRDATGDVPAFDDTIDPATLTDGAGVSWTDHLGAPLQPGGHAVYTIVNRADIPSALSVAPNIAQTQTVGKTATIAVTASDNAGLPYAERPIVYTIGEANPKTGSVLTNAAGVATIAYTGTVAGADTVHMFLDLAGSGSQTTRDPSASAQVVWTTAPATASSRFSVLSAHAARDGTITIVLVPLQEGSASLRATTATAAIATARKTRSSKRPRCKRPRVAIGDNCRSPTTLVGALRAHGSANLPLRLVVKPTRTVAKALARGKAVPLTARLSYRSAFGGAATARMFRFTVRLKSRRQAHTR